MPGVDPNLAGPPNPVVTPAEQVVAVLHTLLPTSAAFESVVGEYFVSSSPGGPAMLFFPGAPLGTPFGIGGPAWRLLMNAVGSSELAGGFVLVMGPSIGRGRLAACRGTSIVVMFGRLLGRMRVMCLAELTRPGLLRHRHFPHELITRLVAAARVLRSQPVGQPHASSAGAGAGVTVASFTGRVGTSPVDNRPAGAPAPPAAPTAPTPVPTAPAPSPAPAPSGSHDGGRAPVNGILATLASLAALMFAGFVRHRQWPPIAPYPRLLASPG